MFVGGFVVLFCFCFCFFLGGGGCLTSQQRARVSQGRICSDMFTCCHNETDTSHLTQSQYTDTGPTSPSTDPITTDAWQGSHWSVHFFLSQWYDSARKNPVASGNRTPDLPLSWRTPEPLGQRGREACVLLAEIAWRH